MEKKVFHVFFTELSNSRKTHWRKVVGKDEKQAPLGSKMDCNCKGLVG